LWKAMNKRVIASITKRLNLNPQEVSTSYEVVQFTSSLPYPLRVEREGTCKIFDLEGDCFLRKKSP